MSGGRATPSASTRLHGVGLWMRVVDNFMICGQVGACSGQAGGYLKNLEISGQKGLCDPRLLA
jgi:hypothetical protein